MTCRFGGVPDGRAELSSPKDEGFTITAVRTNVKYYHFKCGATSVGLDIPARKFGSKDDRIIGFSGTLQHSADGPYFSDIQALHLRLNAFASEPSQVVVNH